MDWVEKHPTPRSHAQHAKLSVLLQWLCCLKVEQQSLAHQPKSLFICLMGDVEKEDVRKTRNKKLWFGRWPREAQQSDQSKHLELEGGGSTTRLYKKHEVGDKGTVKC